jgi:hypothetical protein
MKKLFCSCIILIIVIGESKGQNVGIGTNTPVSKLTIQTPINTTGFTHIGGSNEIIVDEAIGGVSASLGTTSNHPFRLKAGNAGILHVYPTGEVIVGTNLTPSFGRFTVETTNNTYGISHISVEGNILATRMGGTSAGIGTFTNTNMRLFCNSNSAMIIDAANGNIGIGTDAPTTKLHVAGTQKVDGDAQFASNIGIGTTATFGVRLHINQDVEALRLSGNQPYMTFFNGATFKGYLRNIGVNDIELGTAPGNTSGKLNLTIKGAPYLTINNTGQISINGPPAPALSPALTVNGTFAMAGISEWTLETDDCFAPNGPCLIFYGNGFVRSKIDADGDWIALSDRSLKDEIKTYKPVLENIKKLDVVSYHLQYNPASKKSFGLIAQNVAAHFPELVSSFAGKKGEPLLGVSYSKIGVLAIKAIQEQQEIIEQQQNKIEVLEKRLAAIEKQLNKK